MDDLIQELEKLCFAIISRIGEVSYEELLEYTEKRQPVLDKMAIMISENPLTPDQKQCVKDILQYDQEIQSRMIEYKLEASNWLRQRDAVKVQRNAYESSYSFDSMIMDQRK
ncbi:hypothetical protein AMS62_13840 [Bacillus sp. FJAT-18019]|nr:hypothetical protein AMS62_13840 [Bacillus sp. FJAT-18019]